LKICIKLFRNSLKYFCQIIQLFIRHRYQSCMTIFRKYIGFISKPCKEGNKSDRSFILSNDPYIIFFFSRNYIAENICSFSFLIFCNRQLILFEPR
jgi:hypothetical protein